MTGRHPGRQPVTAAAEQSLVRAREELLDVTRNGILPFWRDRAVDKENGGYLTSFDGDGLRVAGRQAKQIVTQTRLVWAFTRLAALDDGAAVLNLAHHGVDFLERHFLDREHGGWRWRVSDDGKPLDEGKLIYGQSFALYALASLAQASREDRFRRLAEATFDAIQRAIDVAHGGYYENLTRDWQVAGDGAAAGDRKTLDTHMHLLESFTELVRLTNDPVHNRALRDVRELICTRMVDEQTGAGGNQYSLDFLPVAPIAINRTWIAERPVAGVLEEAAPANLTSYGHNLELAWLLSEADSVLGELGASDRTVALLAAHSLSKGYDSDNGGVFRAGPSDGEATDLDKEFWQNSEALVGFLEGYRVTGDAAYLEAFLGTWRFARAHLVHPIFGEWRIRTSVTGDVIVADLGNEWKNAYHTGRAALESARRIDALLLR